MTTLKEIQHPDADVRSVNVNVWDDGIVLRFFFEDGGTVTTDKLSSREISKLKDGGIIGDGVEQ